MPLERPRTTRLVESLVVQFEQLIDSGEWQVGSRIPAEGQLVDMLGVSRGTVREAVRALIHAGLLEARRGDGTFVRARNGLAAALARQGKRYKPAEVLELRTAIERHAVQLACAARTKKDINSIAAALKRYQVTAGGDDAMAYKLADRDFHAAVVTASHNEALRDVWDALIEIVDASVSEVISKLGDRYQDFPDHEALAVAVIEGDAQAALVAHEKLTTAAEAILKRKR